MKDLSCLSVEETRKFLNSFDTIITDCDGVLWNLTPYPGVADAITALYNIGKSIKFLSNNALRDFDKYDQLLSSIGVKRTSANFIHPTDTAVDYMVNHNFVGKKVYTIAPEMTNKAFELAGIKVVTAANVYENTIRNVVTEGRDDVEVEGVFIDVDLQLNYLKIFKAVSILHRPEVPLIVGALDKLLPLGNSLYPGPGLVLDMFTKPTNKQPVIIGKPGKYLRKVVKQKFNLHEPRRVLFIGDSMEQDIAFGSVCDFQTLLVFSGLCSKENMDKNSEDLLRPDFYLSSIADFTHIIRKAEY